MVSFFSSRILATDANPGTETEDGNDYLEEEHAEEEPTSRGDQH